VSGGQLVVRLGVVPRRRAEGGELGAAHRFDGGGGRDRQDERRDDERDETAHGGGAGPSRGAEAPLVLGGGADVDGGAPGSSGAASQRDVSAPTPCASSWRSK